MSIEAKSTLIPCVWILSAGVASWFTVPKGYNIANYSLTQFIKISWVFNQSKMTIFYMMLQLDNCPLISSSVLTLKYNFFSTHYNNTTWFKCNLIPMHELKGKNGYTWWTNEAWSKLWHMQEHTIVQNSHFLKQYKMNQSIYNPKKE